MFGECGKLDDIHACWHFPITDGDPVPVCVSIISALLRSCSFDLVKSRSGHLQSRLVQGSFPALFDTSFVLFCISVDRQRGPQVGQTKAN